MKTISAIRRQPHSILNDNLIFRTKPEIAICLTCPLPSKKCGDGCKRYKEEMQRIKLKNKKQKIKEGKAK